MLAGVLVAGLFMPAVGASGQVARGGVEYFDSLPEDLTVGTLSQQSRILWADGSPMATFYFENRVLVPLADVAPQMRQAVVAIEDSRFYDHNGADPKGIMRAMVNNASGGDTQGASTLTQQWIKNVLLDQANAAKDKKQISALLNPDKGRKVREIKLALAAEKEYTKDQILENYLNIALFGDGQFGVETASLHFLSKSAKDLTLEDSALLAGIIRSPKFLDPVDYPDAALERRNVVLQRMLDLKVISQAEHDAAEAVPLAAQLKIREVKNGCEAAGSAAYFCDYVVKTMLTDGAFGADVADRQRLLYRGGLTITTTLDPRRQDLAQIAVNERVPPTDPSGVGVALSSVETGTGRVVAMAQNRVFAPQEEPVPGGTSINFNVDQAYGGGVGFQPGSTYKPFTLATWLAKGRSLTEEVDASLRKYKQDEDFTASCGRLESTEYEPNNSEGRDRGNISVLQATYGSVNTAYMDMASQLDLCAIRDTAAKMGVHRADGNELQYTPGTVLGTNEVAPLTMAAAYATFANSGTYCKPLSITSVTDSTGKSLAQLAPECSEVIAPDVANGVAYAMTQTLAVGTAKGTDIGRPAAGKTGTTNSSSETWFSGFTSQGLSTSVWVGTPNTEPSSLNDLNINGLTKEKVFGATHALPVWARYMTPAVEGMPVVQFQKVAPKVEFGVKLTVPRIAGMSISEAQEALEAAGLKPGRVAYIRSRAASRSVVGSSPGSGAPIKAGTTVTILVSNGRSGSTTPRSPAPTTRVDPAPAPPVQPAPAPPVQPAPAPAPAPAPTPPVQPAPAPPIQPAPAPPIQPAPAPAPAPAPPVEPEPAQPTVLPEPAKPEKPDKPGRPPKP